MFYLLTWNKTSFMYFFMMFLYYMYTSYTFSSGAPTPLSPAKAFRLLFLSAQSKLNSIQWSVNSQETKEKQERLPRTRLDHHADLSLLD